MLVTTIVAWVGGGGWAPLRSGTLVEGEWWRLVTYPLVQGDPLGLLFGGLMIWFFGPALTYDWGERGFLWRQLVVTVGAGLVTLLLGALLGVSFRYVGIWALVDGLIFSWALRYPHQQVMIYFVVPVTGRVLGLITLAVNALYLLFALSGRGLVGLVEFTPPLAALGVAWVLERGPLRLPLRRWRIGLRDWRLERQHRRRSKHLQVVGKDGARGKQWLN
jgi:membrane associated rhomboid family serine protease